MNLANQNERLRRKVSHKLNYRKPEYPPGIFYIRRTPKLLNRFLNDPKALRKAMENSPEEHRPGYNYFKLQPIESSIVSDMNSRWPKKKRNFLREDDPFYAKYTEPYE